MMVRLIGLMVPLMFLLCPVRGDEAAAIVALERLKPYIQLERDDKRPGKPVIGVRLGTRKISDADLIHLKELKSLRRLAFPYHKSRVPGSPT